MKHRMLNWADQFSILLYLDSNNYPDAYGQYECLLAVGNNTATVHSLEALQALHNQEKDWLFGHLCYDYKNVIDTQLKSRLPKKIGFPECSFFIPDTVCYISRGATQVHIASLTINPDIIFQQIANTGSGYNTDIGQQRFTKNISKDTYLRKISSLRQHIKDGDCYEINFCVESYAEDVLINPLDVFRALNNASPAPFAAFYRQEELYAICASPERYMRKKEEKLVSQPIKGTAKRLGSVQEDYRQKEKLFSSIKERAENVMITDLVRNDLARSCIPGSIQVDELFGVYTFPKVHHLISTISGVISPGSNIEDIISNSFPMGSMTGAPKRIVMQLTDSYEESRRELFSGSIGYISPDGDFDMNVMIRSIYYNAVTQYLSYHTGGAITYDSIEENEWEELLLKGAAIEQLFS